MQDSKYPFSILAYGQLQFVARSVSQSRDLLSKDEGGGVFEHE